MQEDLYGNIKIDKMDKFKKELLLKDLSARLPYDVECKVSHDFSKHRRIVGLHPTKKFDVLVENYCHDPLNPIYIKLENIKPYLFPLSSMTEEQKNELNGLTDSIEIDSYGIMSKEEYDIYHRKPYFECVNLDDALVIIDWLNKKHFDYRGLIGRGLAIDATGLNIY